MKGLARLPYHCFTRIVSIILQGGFLAVFFTFASYHSVCCITPINFADEDIIKRVANGSC